MFEEILKIVCNKNCYMDVCCLNRLLYIFEKYINSNRILFKNYEIVCRFICLFGYVIGELNFWYILEVICLLVVGGVDDL